MPSGFGFRENVRRFLRYECSDAEQDAFYRRTREIRANAAQSVLDSGLVAPPQLVADLKKKGEFAVLGSFEFGSCKAIYAYYPRRNMMEVLECRRPRPQKERNKVGKRE